jgi:hypothetical protein
LFRCLDNAKNLIRDEIKSRVAAGNTYFYSVRQIFRSRATSKAVEIKMYKRMVKTAVVVERENCAVTEMDMKRLGTWGREILRKLYGTAVEQGIWGVRND